MRVKALTDEDYANLAARLETGALDAGKQLKQVHRLLCEGREVETLTPTEQFYAGVFEGRNCVQIPNDYGWEPGIEAPRLPPPEPAPEPKPKRGK